MSSIFNVTGASLLLFMPMVNWLDEGFGVAMAVNAFCPCTVVCRDAAVMAVEKSWVAA